MISFLEALILLNYNTRDNIIKVNEQQHSGYYYDGISKF